MNLWKIQTAITHTINNKPSLWNLIFSMCHFITLPQKMTILFFGFWFFCKWNNGIWGGEKTNIICWETQSCHLAWLGLEGPRVHGGHLWFIQSLKSKSKLLSEGREIKGSTYKESRKFTEWKKGQKHERRKRHSRRL